MKNIRKCITIGIFLVLICILSYQIFKYVPITSLDREVHSHPKRARKNITIRTNNLVHPDERVNVVIPILKKNDFLKGTLRTAQRSMIIYLHHRNDMISKSILSYGTWEGWLVDQFSEYIRNNEGMQILDAGCNVGVYTLTAAALGARVVCVDANPKNTERVAQALVENGLAGNVTICLNAISNVRKDFIMTENDANIGSQNILESDRDPRRVKGIFMDDLLPLFDKDRAVMIKVDIEGREIEAFQRSHRFFEERNVKLVLMEWEYIKRQTDIKFVLDFFTKRKFLPFTNLRKEKPLLLNNYLSWPMDVVWTRM